MIDLPREPNPGEDLDASWGIRVVRALRALLPSGGPGVHVSTGPTGTTISATAPAQDRPGFGQKTDTAVADADAAAPQLRSVEVREAAAATGEGTTPAAEAGTEATPAVPAALQLHDFDDAAPEGCGGVSATVTVPEGGGKCDVEFAMPGDTDPASGDITFAARRIDPETGARSLVWLKLGVKPGEEEGDDEGGDDEPEEEPPPCGNPLNGPPSDPTPELDPDTADPYDDPPLAGGDPTPGDGGKTE